MANRRNARLEAMANRRNARLELLALLLPEAGEGFRAL
jgi:hypothetical protein